MFVLVVYPALGMLATPPLSDLRHLTDSQATAPPPHPAPPGAVPPSYDEPAARVLQYLRATQR